MLQDYFGFIWIGSSQGLNCYNGNAIKTYKQNNKDSLSITSNIINCLFEDSQKRLWIGTSYGGLNLYNRELDIFEHISFKDTNNFNPDNDIVNAIAESPDGNLFVGTKNGMLIFNPLTKTYSRYNHSNTNPFSIVGDNISVLMLDSKNRLWIGTSEYSGLGMYDLKMKSFKTFVDQVTERDTVGLKGLNTICEDYLGRIWVGSRERGLSIFDPSVSQFVDIANFNSTLKSNLLSRIWHIAKDSKNNLWIGSANNGLFIYNIKENMVNNILPEETNKNGLSSPAITYCMEDNGQNMWFCTLGGGVNILRKIKNNFEFHTHIQNENSLSNSFVSSFSKIKRVYMDRDRWWGIKQI
ncbi:MAG: hypothetical protein IPO21_04300 [Bacteroidales bacterium]|nr:hypothetical protein [Bacteroidales bacterium]